MAAKSDIDEAEILDEVIRDLRGRLRDNDLDFDERMKLNDRLLKALNMRQRLRQGRKGRGFNLS